MPKDKATLQQAAAKAANRLHHLSMRYVGALLEACTGSKSVGFLPANHPGLRQCRDLIDQVLMCRAEVNGLMQMMHDAGLFPEEKYLEVMAEQYEWFAQTKAKFLGVEVTDVGITIHNPLTQN